MFRGRFDDIVFVGRALRRRPSFAIVTVLILSAALGGTTLVFSAVDAILVRRLPVSSSSEIARLVSVQHNRPPVGDENPFGVYEGWRSRSRSFVDSFAQSDLQVSFKQGSFSERARAEIVTGEYFSILDTPPALGRLLTRQDEWGTQTEMPAVLSYDFWSKRFGRDPHVLGRVLRLDDQPFTVVGVTGNGFSGISIDSGPDLRVPFIAGKFLAKATEEGPALKDPRRCCLWEIAGRLRPGWTIAQAQPETSASIGAAWEEFISAARPVTEDDRRWIRQRQVRVEGIERGVSRLRDRFQTGLLALMCAVALFLTLACASVAGLLLARVTAREREIAVRLALGATPARVVRQWLVESALLALLGGLGGLLIAWICLPLLDRLLPPIRNLLTEQLPVTLHVALNMRVFGFAILICACAAILTGASPAWHASRTDLITALKSGDGTPGRMHLRMLLVGVQVAICTLVLANLGLMVETLYSLDHANAGFDRDHVVTFTLDTALQKYTPEQVRSFALHLAEETRHLPGVSSAAIAARALMRGGGIRATFGLVGSRPSASDALNTDINMVSAGYFETMGMRLLAGRTYDDRDTQVLKPVSRVVNQSFVDRFFAGVNPIGQTFGNSEGEQYFKAKYQIVGVVADARYRSLREASFPQVFECICQSSDMLPNSFFQLEVRSHGKPSTVIPAVQGVLRGMGHNSALREVRTLGEDIEASLWTEHMLARLGSVFSVLSALLTGVSLYGLLSYVVGRKSREIGIRVALGARPADVVKVIFTKTLFFVLAGIVAGLAISAVMGQFLRSLLYGVSYTDKWAYGIGAVLVMTIAALATTVPAFRAARLDPSVALRRPA
jgi:predicted permease